MTRIRNASLANHDVRRFDVASISVVEHVAAFEFQLTRVSGGAVFLFFFLVRPLAREPTILKNKNLGADSLHEIVANETSTIWVIRLPPFA